MGHFNHSNVTVSGQVTGGILGGLIGIVLSNSLLEVTVLGDASMVMKSGIFSVCFLVGIFGLGLIMRKLFNSPEMHIWHHSYKLPKNRRSGINFGLILAIWDYIFGTAYIPHDGRDIRLGFPEIEKFPNNFAKQKFTWV